MPAPAPAPGTITASPLSTDTLLGWYRRERRDLPWRPRKSEPTGDREANPYHVLVSEAMLQQTQVATVLPYFARFIEAFPTVHDLAKADEQRVLTLWQGLGYYSRARNLRKAARVIVDQHGGRVPASAEALLKLPGVGRYTAGAVASIAFNRPAPILDGNVIRVLSRYYGIEAPVDRPATQRGLWDQAATLVERSGHPGDFNQAMMELGALICKPRSPRCLFCPVRDGCAAFATGRVESLPVKTPKRRPLAVTHTVIAMERRGKYLFERRPETGLWAGMWQLPTIEGEVEQKQGGRGRVASRLAKHRLVAIVQERFNLTVSTPRAVDSFTHQTTHRTIRFDVLHVTVTGGRLKARTGTWRPLTRLDDLPLAKPQQRAVSLLAHR